jgi:hypothetical protein
VKIYGRLGVVNRCGKKMGSQRYEEMPESSDLIILFVLKPQRTMQVRKRS